MVLRPTHKSCATNCSVVRRVLFAFDFRVADARNGPGPGPGTRHLAVAGGLGLDAAALEPLGDLVGERVRRQVPATHAPPQPQHRPSTTDHKAALRLATEPAPGSRRRER
eukprot:2769501-Rhodomonas_salina.1